MQRHDLPFLRTNSRSSNAFQEPKSIKILLFAHFQEKKGARCWSLLLRWLIPNPLWPCWPTKLRLHVSTYISAYIAAATVPNFNLVQLI